MKPSQLPLEENKVPVANAHKNIILQIARTVRFIGDLEVDEQSQQEIKERRQNVESRADPASYMNLGTMSPRERDVSRGGGRMFPR